MDESALRILISNLEASRSSLHEQLHWFTWLVVVGLGLDVAIILKEFRDDWKEFRHGRVHPYEIHLPKRPSIWLLILGFLGTMLIVAGVAGELHVDVKVAKVETDIRVANDSLLGLIIQEAGDARVSADKAAGAAKGAKGDAGRAQKKAGAVSKRTDELTQKLSTDEQGITELEAKRAELETALKNLAVCNAPRVIPFWSIGNTKTSIDPLKAFAGRQVIIEFVPDAETRRAALNIYGSLDRAHWKIIRFSPLDGIEEGVEIQPYVAPLPSQSGTPLEEWYSLWQSEIRSNDAADKVIDFLHSYNWQATRGWPTDEKGQLIRDPKILPPDTIRIRVGLYPAVTYVSPPGAKDFAEATAKFDQQREAIKKQMDKERAKRTEELLRQLTPQQAREYKDHMGQRKKEDEQLMERLSGPCKPLNSLAPSLP